MLVPALIEGFALRNGYRAERTDQDEVHFIYDLFQGPAARRVARFLVRIGTTNEGFADLPANEADIALALREVRLAEIQRAYDAGLEDMTDRRRSLVLSLDAMVPVVAPDNPIIEISPTDLARFFAGQISNWVALGGPDAPLALHLPSVGSGLSQTVDDKLMAPADLVVAPDIVQHRITSQIAAAVARVPFAIGQVHSRRNRDDPSLGPDKQMRIRAACKRRTIKTEQDRGLSADRADVLVHAGAPIAATCPGLFDLCARSRRVDRNPSGGLCRSSARDDCDRRSGGSFEQRHPSGGSWSHVGRSPRHGGPSRT